MAESREADISKFQAFYFIAAGDTYSPRVGEIKRAAMLENIRSCYQGEIRAAENYMTLAAGQREESAMRVYREMAVRAKMRSEKLQELIFKIME